jgi:ferric-dicitrate binding protein FerR (iron transport regulator)
MTVAADADEATLRATALADEKIIGRFRAKEPDSFAREVSLAFGARIEREGSRIRIEQN